MSPTATNIIAQRESLGDWQINAPTLKASNKSHINVARFQRAIASFIQIQRFSLGGEAGMFVIFDDLIIDSNNF
jgi:hypothetical protein